MLQQSVVRVSLAGIVFAQTATDASLLGIVKDSSGAAVPGATVRVDNLDTGLAKSSTSGEAGAFEVLALPRGVYSVTVTKPQFLTWRLARIEMTAGEQRRLSPTLQVGDVQQTVTVEAGVELMQTEKASVEAAIEEKQIRDLPINGRNPIELVNLVPGMRFNGAGGLAAEHTVTGLGTREDQTGFTVDSVDSNDPSNERGIAFPNLESVAQFAVQTSSFGAENGRNPLQVMMVTKSGTNQFHGTLWEFHRNAKLDARNTFALTIPKLIRNQYGFSLGGPVVRNRTHFFSSLEGTRIRRETIYNSVTINPSMLEGEFGARRVNDPLAAGAQFPGNRIPVARFSAASRFLFPYVLTPNAEGNRFRAVAPQPSNLLNAMLRADHQIGSAQRFYVRWIRVQQTDATRGYRPDVIRDQDLVQHNLGLNYNWTATPSTLVTVSGGYVQSDTVILSPVVGQENLTDKAGIRGFPTAGREEAIGLPNVNFTGYTGFSVPSQVPGRFRREILNGKISLNSVRGRHSLSGGYEFNERRTLAFHSSSSARGTFTFNGQYTGDGFADYLLGTLQSDERNYPLKAFGMSHSPYSALYAQDFWRVSQALTLTLGVRWDHWHEKGLVRDNGATFDLARGKAVAAVTKDGRVDLTAQPSAPFLAAATRGLWITATEAGIPRGLFEASGYVSPRLGFAWRLRGRESLVLRGGYGIFTSSYNGNITGSQVIGPPYWTFERQTFTAATRQSWETAFPAEPTAFIAPSVTAAHAGVDPMKMHEFNLALQAALPWIGSAATLSYVGNRGRDLITRLDHNEVPPGRYTSLQAARPYPALGPVRLYENIGRSWYNSLQLKVERRFTRGFGYTVAYAFARNIDELGASITDSPTPFSPQGYERGRSQLERRHVLTTNAIYELPFGRGLLGGWKISGIYSFTSGEPLNFTVPGATLGNGFNTRPNLAGDPKLSSPTADLWFNPAAFTTPAPFAFGNSGIGLLDAPGVHLLDLAVLKDFRIRERARMQFRWELFNAPNHVNLNGPLATLGQTATGRITSAGAARQMQFGLKLIF
ncbi:MAG: TonB-dependent receptor domain-containing protein [Bryobacteraceae bacterium]